MVDDPYSLDRLEDIVVPEAVSWWPPAPFWYCVIAMVAAWLSYGIVVAVCRWSNNAYRRQAIRELESLSDHVGPDPFGRSCQDRSWPTEISTILKRVALVSFPREEVASLSGDDWLRFLSATCDGVDFSEQPTRCLAAASFDPHVETSSSDLKEIVDVAKRWVVGHRAEASP